MDTAIDEAIEWVMGDSTTALEKIAFMHCMLIAAMTMGRMPALDPASALRIGISKLSPDDQRVLLALLEWAPQFKFFAELLPTPGAQIASD